MKKTILLAAFTIAGFASAKNVDLRRDKENDKMEKKNVNSKESQGESQKINCRQVGMFVWCTQEIVSDTVCWGAGSGTATESQAMADSLHNSQLLTEFYCGLGTGSGVGGL
jgi:hypothetical protein